MENGLDDADCAAERGGVCLVFGRAERRRLPQTHARAGRVVGRRRHPLRRAGEADAVEGRVDRDGGRHGRSARGRGGRVERAVLDQPRNRVRFWSAHELRRLERLPGKHAAVGQNRDLHVPDRAVALAGIEVGVDGREVDPALEEVDAVEVGRRFVEAVPRVGEEHVRRAGSRIVVQEIRKGRLALSCDVGGRVFF